MPPSASTTSTRAAGAVKNGVVPERVSSVPRLNMGALPTPTSVGWRIPRKKRTHSRRLLGTRSPRSHHTAPGARSSPLPQPQQQQHQLRRQVSGYGSFFARCGCFADVDSTFAFLLPLPGHRRHHTWWADCQRRRIRVAEVGDGIVPDGDAHSVDEGRNRTEEEEPRVRRARKRRGGGGRGVKKQKNKNWRFY